MLSNKPLIYCNDPEYIIGGVELFNKNLISSFKENELSYELIYKINFLKNFQIIREFFSLVNLIIKSKSEKFDFLLIHHSNFYSIAILPLLKIFLKT